jgi:hypothetical protein
MTEHICCKNEDNIEIIPDKIWEGDLFSRDKVSCDFTKIIKSIKQPFVVSINSKYGTGKSFFLKRWKEELKKEEKVVFFNAWDCDFVEKPLLPFLYNFLEQLKEQGMVEYTFKQDAINSGSVIKEAVKEATRSVFDIDRFLESTKNLCSGDSFRISGNALKEYHELQSVITNFKDNLSNLIKEKMADKNIYIFVDELERCRPTFSIALLESIKHLFNVPGLVFIIATDREQLKHTIGTIYGQGMDGEGYLRRFIDLELNLPEIEIPTYSSHLSRSLFKINNTDNRFHRNWLYGYDQFDSSFIIFSKIYSDMTLREVEQIYAKFNVITKLLQEKQVLFTPILALMLILKVKNNDLYNSIVNLEIQHNDVIALVRQMQSKIPTHEHVALQNYMSLLIAMIDANLDEKMESLETTLKQQAPNYDVLLQEEYTILEKARKKREHIDCQGLKEDEPILYLKKIIEYINNVS